MCTQVCEHFANIAKGGGQNRKLTKNRGRPTGETSKELLQHINSVAPASILSVDVRQLEFHTQSLGDQLSCPVCTAVLDRPVELSCGAIVCLRCCSNWVMHCTSACVPCPCCYDHPLDSTTIRPPPLLIISLLSSMLVSCERKCGNQVRADQYDKHLQGRCRSHYEYSAYSPSKITLKDVLTKPATPVEMKCAQHLVRRILDTQRAPNEQVVKLSTRGQVNIRPFLQYTKLNH